VQRITFCLRLRKIFALRRLAEKIERKHAKKFLRLFLVNAEREIFLKMLDKILAY